MDTWMMELLTGLLITIVVYGAGPMLQACCRKKPIFAGSLKAFCGTYTVLAFVAFFALHLYLGEGTPNLVAAILWGTIFYRIAKAILKKRGLWQPDPQFGRAQSREDASAEREADQVEVMENGGAGENQEGKKPVENASVVMNAPSKKEAPKWKISKEMIGLIIFLAIALWIGISLTHDSAQYTSAYEPPVAAVEVEM